MIALRIHFESEGDEYNDRTNTTKLTMAKHPRHNSIIQVYKLLIGIYPLTTKFQQNVSICTGQYVVIKQFDQMCEWMQYQNYWIYINPKSSKLIVISLPWGTAIVMDKNMLFWGIDQAVWV